MTKIADAVSADEKPDVIQHAVWLYFRFPLSYRKVEDLLAERGIDGLTRL